MESSVEKLEDLAYRLTIEIPADVIDTAVVQQLKTLRSRVRIDGFRPGKVPPHVVTQRYGQSVRQDVIEKEIDHAYQEAINASEHRPIAPPNIALLSGINAGESLKFTATFEVMPTFEVKGLDGIAITLPKSEISEEDIDTMIETLRRQQATFSSAEAEHAAQETDQVIIDFSGTIDGEPFEGGSGRAVTVQIGAKQMLPDFESGLVGLKTGDEKTFDVTFPEDYSHKSLAGKTAQFTVNVKKINIMHLPKLDTNFIQRFGISEGTEVAFKEAVRENMTRELASAQRRIRRERMFDALLAHNNDIAVPQTALNYEMSKMAEKMKLSSKVPDVEKRHQLMRQLFEASAKRHLQLSFLLSKLFETQKIELDSARLNARLDEIASTYENPAEVKANYHQNKQARLNLESVILEEQLIDLLYQNATVTEEVSTFQSVMAINSKIPS